MTRLTVTCTHDPATFLNSAGPMLRAHPVEHSVVLTRSAQALEQTPQLEADADLWLVAHNGNGTVVAAAMHTPPFPIALSLGSDEAVRALAEEVWQRRPGVPGVGGVLPGPEVFAQRWRELGGGPTQVHMRQGIYVCDQVRAPVSVVGQHRLARHSETDQLQRWAEGFERDTDGEVTGTDHVTRRLGEGLLHVWEVGGAPVSMAAVTKAHGGVSRVQLVYTPPDRRGHGYASACVAALTQGELAAGRITMLYTDLANPTSNAIYQQIGYRRAGDAVALRFQ